MNKNLKMQLSCSESRSTHASASRLESSTCALGEAVVLPMLQAGCDFIKALQAMLITFAIHNLWLKNRGSRRIKGSSKHGGEEGGSFLYAPPRKLSRRDFTGFALWGQQVVVKVGTGDVAADVRNVCDREFTCCGDSSELSHRCSALDRVQAEK